MSLAPASLRLATTFDPMNPAPPVTKNMPYLAARPSFAPVRGRAQLLGLIPPQMAQETVKIAAGQV